MRLAVCNNNRHLLNSYFSKKPNFIASCTCKCSVFKYSLAQNLKRVFITAHQNFSKCMHINTHQ